MNVVAMIGRLCQEPEIKMTQSGKKVVSNTVAIDGYGDHTDFIPVVFWEKTAEFVGRYFHKGDRIGITGMVQSRRYTDKEGNNRTAIEIIANRADFCESKGKSIDVQGEQESFEEIEGDGDLPF